MIYNITEILDTYIVYENLLTKPDTSKIDINNDLYADDVLYNANYLDNDDPDFVKDNIERGKIGEDYVEKIMMNSYGNCKKVAAKEGYDFDLLIDNLHVRLEVKTIQGFNCPFHITINEIEHAKDYQDSYYICFAIINQKKTIRELRFLKNPIMSLKIEIPEKEDNGLCIITPEKFMIAPKRGYVKALPDEIV